MTVEQRICRGCDEPITDPDDAVLVAHDLGNSGPGWQVWAHSAHVREAVQPDPDYVRVMARVLIVRALRGDS